MAGRGVFGEVAIAKFQSLKGFQRFCGHDDIPMPISGDSQDMFQSLKGFQRFCGR